MSESPNEHDSSAGYDPDDPAYNDDVLDGDDYLEDRVDSRWSEVITSPKRLRTIVVMIVAAVILIGAIILVVVGVRGGFNGPEADPGAIGNAPSASSNQTSSASSVSSSETPTPSVPPMDTGEVRSKLEACINKATDPANISDVVNDCMFSYRGHVANIWGMRDISALTVTKVDVQDAPTAQFKATVASNDGHELGTITGYWVVDSSQFKITETMLNDYARLQVRDDVLKRVEAQR